ncbi:MAG TPA: purine-nucleoside phosphorylase [Desulfosalsimonadaceae bacterium]|nr:purine-nucleoside phosphorylase [Desulfosalsimonadaceae bacterium]
MLSYQKQAAEAARYLQDRIGPADMGILTGTGLGESIDALGMERSIAYGEIPGFPESTVASHYVKLAAGKLHSRRVVAMQGRFHLYEGYSALEVTLPVRVMQMMGVHTLLLSNAAGGINLHFAPGDIMVIADHINLTGENPLVGENIDDWGPRFPDMTKVYDSALMHTAEKAAREGGFTLQKGIYTGLKGPSLETPAETRFLQRIGGEAVGFSTVLEAIAGAHAGMKILGLSTITNINDPDRPQPATADAIIAVAAEAAPRHARIIEMVARELGVHAAN